MDGRAGLDVHHASECQDQEVEIYAFEWGEAVETQVVLPDDVSVQVGDDLVDRVPHTGTSVYALVVLFSEFAVFEVGGTSGLLCADPRGYQVCTEV